MGAYPGRCQLPCTRTRLRPPCCYIGTLDGGSLIVQHPDFYSGYLAALDESGLVPTDLLLGYPMGPDESGLEPADLALEKG